MSITEKVERLSAAELKALHQRLRPDSPGASVPLTVRTRKGRIPLSFAQERLWFLERLGMVGAAYSMPIAFRLEGFLHVRALEQAFGELLRRHEGLRTRFAEIDGQACQIIDPPGAYRLEVIDVSSMEREQQEEQVQFVLQTALERPFDLQMGPLFAVQLIRLSAEEHVLHMMMHHIVSDGWSSGVLMRDIDVLYAAYVQGKQPSLPELPVQYADYSMWQRERLQGAVLQKLLDFWKKQLANAPVTLEFPTDRPRPAVANFKGGVLTFDLSESLCAELRKLAKAEDVTLYMVVLSAYHIVLSRWSGQRDIIVGSPIAGRTDVKLDDLIGFFVNTLMFRARLTPQLTFRELLQQVKQTALDAYAYQELPFERLVAELQPQRDLSRNPICQAVLAAQAFFQQTSEFLGLKFSSVFGKWKAARFDLTIYINEIGSGLYCAVEYASDLFDVATIERFMGHFRMVLEGIVANPACLVDEIPLLRSDEKYRMLIDWNRTAREFASCGRVYERFHQQAKRTPNAVALTDAQSRLTYRELDERSSQLAHYLSTLGVGPEVIVGLYVERSVDAVIGLLGVLKCGGAYLPLNTAYPEDRLIFMLQDTQAPVLLTTKALAPRLTKLSVRTICLDVDQEHLSSFSTAPPIVSVTDRNLAYVIYTSGSTGTSKGVMVEHAQLTNYLNWSLETYPQSGDAIAVSSPLAFDATATALYGALLTGRTAVLLPEGQELEDLEHLLQQPTHWGLIKVAPAHLQALGPKISAAQPPCHVDAIVVGGEAMPVSTVELWRSIWPDIRIFNQYGPTETVVACTAYEVPREFDTTRSIPIGGPAPNVRVYVLDSRFQPVPIGVPGQLYIAGAQVSRGYLGRASLTAERFIPDPFEECGSRMYSTGDRVRYLESGALEFLGRLDDQIKLRGYRIEPQEVETVLARHPDVRDAVVLMTQDATADQQLVAYLVAAEGAVIESGAIHEYLKQYLPPYMIPSTFFGVPALPRTLNGKVDRNALRNMNVLRAPSAFTAPQGATEIALADIMRRVLRAEEVGRDADFFSIGGHSLLAVQMITQIAEVFRVDLPLRSIFTHPTVGELAALVDSRIVDAVNLPAAEELSEEMMEQGAV